MTTFNITCGPLDRYYDVIDRMRGMEYLTVTWPTRCPHDEWSRHAARVHDMLQRTADAMQIEQDHRCRWCRNIEALSHRIAPALLERLIAEGLTAAPLIADLATATDEELARWQRLAFDT